MPILKRPLFLLLVFTCLSFQLYVQINGLIFHDILWSFEVGKRLLAGKSYLYDYFETNPPLLYYLHGFLQLGARTLHQPIIVIFCSFISLCMLYSLWLSYKIIDLSFGQLRKTSNVLLVSLAVLLALLLNVNYGQKEMIMILLSFPYFWYAGLRLEEKALSTFLSVVIGLFAGLGFAFKPPYFYLPVLFVELFLLFKLRTFKSLVRVELLLVALTFIAYCLISYLLSPSYFKVVFPLIIKSYTTQSFLSLTNLLSKQPMVFFCILTLLWPWLRQLKNKESSTLSPIIDLWFLVSLGFALSFVVQNKGWHYQSLPLYASSLICGILGLIQAYKTFRTDFVARSLVLLISFILGTCFFIYPFALTVYYKMQCRWLGSCDFVQSIDKISKLSPNHDFYMFSTQMESSYFIYYGNLNLSSRFASLWPLPAVFNETNPYQSQINEQLQSYVVEDFKRFKPSMVLVGEHNTNYVSKENFSYIEYMLTNPEFKKIWQQYYHKQDLYLEAERANKMEIYLRRSETGIT